jgi:dTDP-4-dehydrorhamnose 3,5-epimerase
MNIIETNLAGLLLIEPKVFEDSRGYFLESYNSETFKNSGIDTIFVQDNQSFSCKGTLRGLHFQNTPYAQVKLIRVITGSIIDVAVDIRKGSKTYGKYYSAELSGENKKMLYIPDGFAHGFLTLEDNTIVQYKCSNVYNKESEGGIMWNDPDININWGLIDEPIISDKDKNNILFKDLNSKF